RRNFNISVTALCPGPVLAEFGDVAKRQADEIVAPAPDYLTVSVQEVVRQALRAVEHDRARVIPGQLVNLMMTTVVFLPMFLKRLVLNAHVARAKVSSSASTPLDSEISGLVEIRGMLTQAFYTVFRLVSIAVATIAF